MAEPNREEITKLEALYASNPGGRVFTHLAEAYRKAGNLARARTILEQGISKHADSASAHVVLGRVLNDLGAHEEAAVSYRRVLTLDPENRVALRSLGDLSRQADDAHAALGYYRQLLHLDPSDEDVHATVQELTRQEARPASRRDEASGIPAGAWVEPEAGAAGAVPSKPAATPVTSDFALDWATQEDEEGLPGDLAHLARSQTAEPATPQSGEVSFPPDIPDRDGTPGRVLEPEAGTADTFVAARGGVFEMDVQSASETVEFEVDQEHRVADPSFEEMLSSNAGEAPLAAAGETPEVPTETLADLYRSQGFNERAAEVYRALLEQKPGDPELERKLAEVEALLQPLADYDQVPAVPEFTSETAADEQPWAVREVLRDVQGEPARAEDPAAVPTEPDAVQSGEAWLEGVALGWSEPSTVTGAATPYAWKEEIADDQPGGPTLGNYLQKVLSWKPTPAKTPTPSDVTNTPITMGYSDATGTPPEASGTAGTPDRANPASPQVPGLQPPVPMAAEHNPSRLATPRVTTVAQPPAAPDAAPAKVTRATEPATKSATPVTPARPAPASPPAAPQPAAGNAIDDAFDEWFSGGENPQPASAAGASIEPATPPERSEAPADPNASDEESDDDLEMFRSWLQSLKR